MRKIVRARLLGAGVLAAAVILSNARQNSPDNAECVS
jgi:hypothetical protein